MNEKQYSGRTIARAKKKGVPSRTPGKQKGLNCQATSLDKYIAKHNRSYKHPAYAAWCAKKKGHK